MRHLLELANTYTGRNSIYSLMTGLVVAVISLFIPKLLMGEGEQGTSYGQYVLFVSSLSIGSLFAQLGMGAFLVSDIATEASSLNKSKLLSTYLLLSLIVSAPVAILIHFYIWPSSLWLALNVFIYLTGAACFPVIAQVSAAHRHMQNERLFANGSFVAILTVTGSTNLDIIFTFWLLCNSVYKIAFSVVKVTWCEFKIDLKLLLALISSHGKWGIGNGLLVKQVENLRNVVIGRFLTLEILAIYNIFERLVSLSNNFFGAASLILQSRLVGKRLDDIGEHGRIRKAFSLLSWLFCSVTIVAGLVLLHYFYRLDLKILLLQYILFCTTILGSASRMIYRVLLTNKRALKDLVKINLYGSIPFLTGLYLLASTYQSLYLPILLIVVQNFVLLFMYRKRYRAVYNRL